MVDNQSMNQYQIISLLNKLEIPTEKSKGQKKKELTLVTLKEEIGI